MAEPVPDSSVDWSQYEAIVEKRWDHYRPRFERFARKGWISWNWAAFFGTFAWLRYRKLYLWSWGYLAISAPVLLALPAILIGDRCEYELVHGSPDAVRWGILIALVVNWIVVPLVADRIYFNRIRVLVHSSRKDTGTGGYWGALVLQALLGLVLLTGATSRFDSIYRAMVSEGISLAAAAKTPLAEYFVDRGGKLPSRIEEIVETTSGKYVAKVALNPDGEIKAVFGEGGRKLSGHSVSMVPTVRGGRIVEWACRSNDLPNSCLPPSCRRN